MDNLQIKNINSDKLTIAKSITNSVINTKTNISILKKTLYNKYFGYLLGIISLFLLYQLLQKRYKHNKFITENKYYIDDIEIIPNINYYLYSKNNIIYLFWNGNLNSTYILYYLLIDKGLPVQTIYIKNYTINENLKNNTNYKNIKHSNNNKTFESEYYKQNEELKRMNDIRKIIYEDYPFCKSLFLPTFYVYCIHKNLNFTQNFKKNTQFIVRPNINTIERIIRFSHYSKINRILLSIDNEDIELYNVLKNNNYLNKIKLPLINMNKETIKLKFISQKNHKKVKLLLYLRNYK